jgi:hypothetical protein
MSIMTKTAARRLAWAVLAIIATPLALPAWAQQGNAPSPEVAAARAEFAAACNKAATTSNGASRTMSSTWFGSASERARRVLTLDDAVQAKRDALKGMPDRVAAEIATFLGQQRREAEEEQRTHHQAVPNPLPGLDLECIKQYVAFLQAVDAPSLAIAKREAGEATAAEVEQQKEARQAQLKAEDEANAEQLRRRKEAAAAAAQAEQERLDHQAAAAAAQRKEAEEEAAQALKEQTERTAQAQAAAADARKAAESAAQIAKLHDEEQAALEARRQADAAAKEAQERAAREADEQVADQAARAREETQRREAEKLPPCADDAVLEALKGAVADSPAGKMEGLRVLGIDNVADRPGIALDIVAPKRFCIAKLKTTAGTLGSGYTVTWMSGDHDQIWVEVTIP